MSVRMFTLSTERGDTLTLTTLEAGHAEPVYFLTIDDPDGTVVPTAQLTLEEASELRRALYRLGAQW